MSGFGPRLALGCLVLLASFLATPARGAPPPLAWELVSHDTPLFVWADRERTVTLVIRNTGTATWSEQDGDHLSYRWLTVAGQPTEASSLRTGFASPVGPGQEVEVLCRLKGPSTSGVYALVWAMVREHVRWYLPSTPASEHRLTVWATRKSAWQQSIFAALTVGLILASWRFARRRPGWRWPLAAVIPPLWTWAALALLSATFAELLGRQGDPRLDLVSVSGAALFAIPTALAPVRLRRWAGLAVVLMVTMVLLADLAYLRYFGSIVPVAAISALHQLGQVEGSARALVGAADRWLLPTAGSFLLFALLWPGRRMETPRRRLARRTLALAPLVLLLAAGLPALRAIAGGLSDRSLSTKLFSHDTLVSRMGVLNLHVFNTARTAREWFQRGRTRPHERAAVRAYIAARRQQGPESGAGYGIARGANLVLIQAESLQAWVVGATIAGAPVMPFLSSLGERALAFPNLFDQSEQGRSSDGEFTALNSLYPLPEGAVAFRRDGNRFVALPTVLRRAGYTTLSAHAFTRGFWNRAVLHPRYGFERMMFREELGSGEKLGWGLADDLFLARMIPTLGELKEPFFAFLITLGLHHPFDRFPDRHKVLDVGELTDTPLGNYLHAMHYVDGALERFVGALAETGLLGRTVVALYGDHEAGLGSPDVILELAGMGPWNPSSNARLWRVPFLVMLPEGRLAGPTTTPGGHVDIAPTLLFLLGVERPESFLGASLLPERDRRALIRTGGAVEGNRMFVARGNRILPGGACFAFPSGKPLPLAACGELGQQSAEELEISRLIVDHNLAWELAGY